MATEIAIAVEDALSECVLRRLLQHVRRDISISARYPLKELPGGYQNPKNRNARRGLSGFGQLKVNLPAFNQASNDGMPFFVLTDLDVHVKCPGQLLGHWLGKLSASPNLVFRVAVREVEAWLLADAEGIAHYLAVPKTAVSTAPESLADPKLEIVELAKQSTSIDVIRDMVPVRGSSAEVGRCFDRALANFVREQWDIDQAAKNSQSLKRAIQSFRGFRKR